MFKFEIPKNNVILENFYFYFTNGNYLKKFSSIKKKKNICKFSNFPNVYFLISKSFKEKNKDDILSYKNNKKIKEVFYPREFNFSLEMERIFVKKYRFRKNWFDLLHFKLSENFIKKLNIKDLSSFFYFNLPISFFLIGSKLIFMLKFPFAKTKKNFKKIVKFLGIKIKN
jgi:hypothetical protein